MDTLMLDGNAIAGLLQEVFAPDMTSAIASAATAARESQSKPFTFTEGPDSSCAVRTLETRSRQLSAERTRACASTSLAFAPWTS